MMINKTGSQYYTDITLERWFWGDFPYQKTGTPGVGVPEVMCRPDRRVPCVRRRCFQRGSDRR